MKNGLQSKKKKKKHRNEIQQSCAQKIQLKQKERREATAQDNI